MTKEELIKKAQESPALTIKSKLAYPFGDKVPLMVKVKVSVVSDLPTALASKVSPVCLAGMRYYVWVNSYGAVSAILENGEMLGLKLGEFEIIEWHPLPERFIVAEVSKSWKAGDPVAELLSQKFEAIINVNEYRGYKLSDWKLGQVCNGDVFTETIIAIFEKKE